MSRVVAVVGGGISGLAAARALAGARPASLELRDHLESSQRRVQPRDRRLGVG